MEITISRYGAYGVPFCVVITVEGKLPFHLDLTREELRELGDKIVAYELELQEREHRGGKA